MIAGGSNEKFKISESRIVTNIFANRVTKFVYNANVVKVTKRRTGCSMRIPGYIMC
jgi:hypothetical protein